MSESNATLRIIQFSDPHLYAEADGELRGVVTLDSFQRVIATARDRHWPPDAILLTGDIAQDESAGAYRRAIQVLTGTGVRVLCLPGNHDDPELMEQEFSSPQFSVGGAHVIGNWQVVMLSSYVRNSAAGRVSDDDLVHLDRHLAARPDLYGLIAVHHHPVPSGSRWLDTVALENAEDLFAVIERHSHVRALVWGHVHQEMVGRRNGVALLGTPSTCAQFLPSSELFRLDTLPPAYRWLELEADGRLRSEVEWIGEES